MISGMRNLFLALFLFLPAAADADRLPDGMMPGETAVVASVVDGDTVVLAEAIGGAEQVRLVGIQAPKLPLGRPGFKEWPLAPESKAKLEELVLGRHVRLAFGGTRMDRHGRHLAHLVRDDGLWIQGEMLKSGMARVYTFPDNRRLATDMQALERDAREDRRGIWAVPFYAVRDAADVGHLRGEVGTFQVIEGTVLDAAQVRGRVYLNFGTDWRSDFTVSISPKDRKTFEADGIDPIALKGKPVRVRGWLRKRNGPMIEATHPEQIEVLETD